MKTNHTKTYRICLLFLASIVFVFNNAQGFVHCQSEDGHSGLEPITNTCCNAANINISPENTADSFGKTLLTNREGCGPCVDTIVSNDVINADKKTVPLSPAIAAVPAILNITDAYDGYSGPALRSEFPASVNPSLPSLRTIILIA